MVSEVVEDLQGGGSPAEKNTMGRPRWRGWLAVVLALAPLTLAAQPTTLENLFRESQGRDYQPPSPDELRQAEQLFQRAFAGRIAAAEWATLGFQVERVSENTQVFTVIREQPDWRRGCGFYVFAAPASPGAPILQAPHALSDQHTGAIALHLFAGGQFAAGAWSTAPRRYQDDEDETVVDADMAHQPNSYFTAFSRAAALAQPASAILQLHGFSADKRKTEAGRVAGVIVSAGQRQPTPAAEQTARCLSEKLAEPVLLYPRDVRELGGLTNQIGRVLRTLGSAGFVHIELAQPVREQLRVDAELRQRFGACLARVQP